MSIVIAIMAKDPRAAEVKTRLAAKLGPAERSRLYRAFLSDKVCAARSIAGARAAIVYTPRQSREWFEAFAGPDVALYAQCDGDLGARVTAAFEVLLASSAGAILTDSDTPNLPHAYLLAAVDALRSGCEPVFGPTDDGGYYLVGLCRPRPAMFAEVAWSTPRALRDSVEGAERMGLDPCFLPAWYDIDEPRDLSRLAADVAAQHGAACPHTRAALRELGLDQESA